MYKIRCLNKLGETIHNIYYIKWCSSDFVHQWYQHDLQSLLEGRDRFRITRCHSQGWKIPGCQSKKILVQTYIANMVPSPLREKRWSQKTLSFSWSFVVSETWKISLRCVLRVPPKLFCKRYAVVQWSIILERSESGFFAGLDLHWSRLDGRVRRFCHWRKSSKKGSAKGHVFLKRFY